MILLFLRSLRPPCVCSLPLRGRADGCLLSLSVSLPPVLTHPPLLRFETQPTGNRPSSTAPTGASPPAAASTPTTDGACVRECARLRRGCACPCCVVPLGALRRNLFIACLLAVVQSPQQRCCFCLTVACVAVFCRNAWNPETSATVGPLCFCPALSPSSSTGLVVPAHI